MSAFSAEEASQRRQFSERTRSGFLAAMRDLAASESSVLRREVRLEMHMQEPPQGEVRDTEKRVRSIGGQRHHTTRKWISRWIIDAA